MYIFILTILYWNSSKVPSDLRTVAGPSATPSQNFNENNTCKWSKCNIQCSTHHRLFDSVVWSSHVSWKTMPLAFVPFSSFYITILISKGSMTMRNTFVKIAFVDISWKILQISYAFVYLAIALLRTSKKASKTYQFQILIFLK